jgi:hypothetical protein
VQAGIRKALIMVAVATALAALPAGLSASRAVTANVVHGGVKPDLPRSVFDAGTPNGRALRLPLSESLSYAGTRAEMPPVSAFEPAGASAPSASSGTGRGKRIAIAMVSSAIVPGLGELYLYRESRSAGTLARVPVFMAIDAYLWYGRAHNRAKGKDIEADFRRFADEHWSLNRFLQGHPCCQGLGGCDSWQDYNAHCQSELLFFIFTPKEADEQEYYENIGKYNAFVFGWDDAEPYDINNPNEFKEYQYWTPNRTYYWSLRKDSDKYLLRADQHLMLLIVNRVASMIDAGWIAYRMSKGQDPDTGWSLRLRTYDEAPCLMISRRF